jgi:hypothetical protein
MAAGLVAAGVMSAVRLLAHRAGLIDQMVPQILQQRASGEAGVRAPGGTAGQQLAAEVIHHAVGLTAGGVLGAATFRPGLATGIAYGLGIWLTDVLGLMPALRVRRTGGHAVDAAAHVIFGATLALAMGELAAQPRQRPVPRDIPLLRRVG